MTANYMVLGAGKRRSAALLAIFLGAFGIHKFYLGYTGAGMLMLLASTVGLLFVFPTLIAACVAVFEGIVYLRKDDFDFAETYIYESRPWF